MSDLLLAPHTTLGLGGPARHLVHARDDTTLIATVRAADDADEPLLLLGGGSNVVLPDEGFPGTVVLVRTSGVTLSPDASGERVLLHAAAGEGWDGVVARSVAEGLAGIECLAGIPGRVGATPVQNVGAYGQDVSATIVKVEVWDRREQRRDHLDAPACGFGYRTSALKRDPGRHVVLAVTYALQRSATSAPVRYAELARALGVDVGATVALAAVPPVVVALRRSKGMVVAGDDPDPDPDTRSVGSFFTNPVLPIPAWEALRERASALGLGAPPHWPEGGQVKVSAAWLVQHAGFAPGHSAGAVGVSGKHALALTHRGGGSTRELLALARAVRDGVRARFGVEVVPEPVLVGTRL